MLNLSCISCLTRTDFNRFKGTSLDDRHKEIFKNYEEKPLYNFARIMMRHLPVNLVNFLSDEDMVELYKYLFDKVEKRKKKKLSVDIDTMEELPFFVGNFCIASIVTDDRPFIYDSLWEYFGSLDDHKLFVVHPIFGIKRDRTGKITEIGDSHVGGGNESFVVIFMEDIQKSEVKTIKSDISEIYSNVMAAVDDFQSMNEVMHNLAMEFREKDSDVSKFIHWLMDENFIFQGTRVVEIDEQSGERHFSDLGVFNLYTLEPNYSMLLESVKEGKFNTVNGYPVVVDKSLKKSLVKERSHFDRIIFIDNEGPKTRLVYLLGLFSSVAHKAAPHEISIVKEKVRDTLDYFNFVPGSHDYKWIRDILDHFPKTEIFNFEKEAIAEILELILSMQGANQLRICYRDFRPLKNIFFFIAMPLARFSTELVEEIRSFLELFFNATTLDISIRDDQHKRSFLHFHLIVKDASILDNIDEAEIKAGIMSMLKDWDTYLYDMLRERLGGGECDQVFKQYSPHFNEAYKSKNTPAEGYLDIIRLMKLKGISSVLHSEGDMAILRIYSEKRLLLTELMPILDNLGLKVFEQDIYEIELENRSQYINVVYFADIADPEVFAATYQKNIPELVTAILSGKVENDRVNALAVSEKLTWRQIDILRGLRYFIKQIDSSFYVKTLSMALIDNNEIAAKLVQYFELKFNPSGKKKDTTDIEKDIRSMIESVESASEDKALRYFLKVIQGIVRTNYYMEPQREYISFKIKSKDMPIISEPRPMFEIYVHSASMEGVHLRGGKVARGGIRFSDRNDDFRTEILGLVKTQMVKNAVIVPVGSKGGFIVKQRFAERSEDRENIVNQYKNFISGLLDITDNYKGTKVVHPKRVRIYDENDPYLVVAADKGTATFSDIANSISVNYGFWLGDAFASGGSTGYDHKKVGITAKGAWESVKRHFRERGKDIQNEEFTVIGIGDMSGDVFGNGMLLSRKIRLKAAFNHMHIFLDPNPDAETSYKERQRLFRNPQMNWKDYDIKLISKGGGIFDRAAKRINLTPEIKEMLATSEDTLTGGELIQCILRMEAELLWNGGIGTYVKASFETDRQVGDPSNDDVRVDADAIRVKVIGEGGNLGFTQLARMQFAELGGHVYTDALDNSGGVDMSDHEVNLKIIFNHFVEQNLMKDMKERNSYIRKITPEVTDLVLNGNYSQSMTVSSDLMRYSENPVTYRETARFLRDEGLLDFRIEHIRFTDAERTATAPELAILLSYAKIHLYNHVEGMLNLDNPLVYREYNDYYPKSVVERYGKKLDGHKLMSEITATAIVNRIMNQTGSTFFYELSKSTNRPFEELVENYLLGEELFGCREIRADIRRLDNRAQAKAQYLALMELEKTIKVSVEWLILDENRELLKGKEDQLQEVFKLLPRYMTDDMKDKYNYLIKELTDCGIPKTLATKVCRIRYNKPAFDVFRIVCRTGMPVRDVLKRYYEIGRRFEINTLTQKMKGIKIKNEWERVNKETMLIKLKRIQMVLSTSFCMRDRNWLHNLLDTESGFIENYDRFMESARNEEIDSLVPFNVIIEMFATVADRYEVKG
ncbi:NAD-glutamate dehydrogenase domain-containing protein [Limisalsivibrio acetivorans]|uniref:NAD-glutamate dehydrogenase domain-containing protein n=1 Tax=Limisalsivibrio acetivorans TaxID=1304888 RepID=UPI0003B5BF86|nr:NAD-glutamate dehydrogenase domain-containing protein [Limisalsivibrio acetivorans]